MPTEQSRSARIEARITPDALAVVKRTAELQGRSVSDFVVAAAQEAAHRTIEETQIIRLSVKEQERFVNLLLNPPEFSPALKRAGKAHAPSDPETSVMPGPFIIEALDPSHDRESFCCGVEPLDRYFQKQAAQDVRRRATACYVALEAAAGKVAGYYTLAAAGIPLADMPPELAKRLPRYPSVPVARLGRLAVDHAYRGRKLGAALLWDAVQRCLRSEIAVLALVVDAKDDQAEAFYRHHGFMPFGDRPRQLVLPLTKRTGRA